MGDGQHQHGLLVPLECDDVRESSDRPPARHRDPRAVPRTRERRCEAQRAPRDAGRGARRWSSSFRMSARTVSQLAVGTRPSATSSERRRSSSAQAAATSSSGSSKLESSSSATLARSVRGRRNASASRSSVDMSETVPSAPSWTHEAKSTSFPSLSRSCGAKKNPLPTVAGFHRLGECGSVLFLLDPIIGRWGLLQEIVVESAMVATGERRAPGSGRTPRTRRRSSRARSLENREHRVLFRTREEAADHGLDLRSREALEIERG